jgi:HEAT repeat protein
MAFPTHSLKRLFVPEGCSAAVGLTLVLLVAVSPAWAAPAGPQSVAKEPATYKGKPASFWIHKLQDKDVQARREAVMALKTIGPEAHDAVPALLLALRDDDDSAVREGTVDALGEIGPGAKAAIPALLRAVQDRDIQFRCRAMHALGKVGAGHEVVIRTLAKMLLEDKTGPGRQASAEALRQMGPKAKLAIPSLRRVLQEKSEWSREAAIRVLAAIGPDAVPALTEAVQVPRDRDWVVRAFAQMGPRAATAVSPLQEMLEKSKDVDVRLTVVQVLRIIGPEAVPALVRALRRDADLGVRRQAAYALGTIGRDAEPAIPDLMEALRDPDLGPVAGQALGRMGPKAAAPLLAVLHDKSSKVRGYAYNALEQLGPALKPVIPDLVRQLKGDEATRTATARLLHMIGPDTIPALLTAMRDKEDTYAWLVIGQLGPKATGALPALLDLLKDKEPVVRQRAARALGIMGQAARPAAPALREATQDPDADVRRAATEALKMIPGG